MHLTAIHISSFGTLRDRDFTLGEGLNLILGDNESGKSALSMFLKFVFYGLSGRSAEDGLSEKERFLSWNTDEASGSVTLTAADGKSYRIERTLRAAGRDECRIIDGETGAEIRKGETPGEVFFGLTEAAFVNTVFVRQMTGTAVSGSAVAAAIENLLVSGDETVNTKLALKKLDDERRLLLHKNERGGLLYEKREEVAALEARLAAAREKNEAREIAAAELARLQAQEKEKEQSREPLAVSVQYYHLFEKKRRLDALREAEIVRREKQEALGAFPEDYPDRTLEAALRQSAAVIESLERSKEQSEEDLLRFDKRLSRMSGADAADTDVSAVAGEGKALSGQAARSAAVGAGSFVIAAIAAAGTIFAAVGQGFGGLFFAAAGGAVLFLLLGIVMLARRGRLKASLRGLLDRWGADDLAALESAAQIAVQAAKERRAADARRAGMADQLRLLDARLTAAKEEAARLADRAGAGAGILPDRIAEALTLVGEACGKKEEADRALREAEVRCAVLSSQFGEESPEAIEKDVREALGDEAGRAASEMTAADYAEAAKRLDLCDRSLPLLHQQIVEKTRRLAELNATAEVPARVSEELEQKRCELAAMEEKYAALRLAYDTLSGSAEAMRRDVLPRIMREAGRLMDIFSRGKYDLLGADASFAMTFREGDATRSLAYLSAGTRDLAYVSLRLALISVLCGENRAPAVFDESFASVDDERLDAAASLLASKEAGQTIWFSCRRAEAEAAARVGGTVIRL